MDIVSIREEKWNEDRGRYDYKWSVNKSPVAREYFVKKEIVVREDIHKKAGKCHITDMTSPPKGFEDHHKVDRDIMRKALDTLKGYQVVARNDEDGLYYPGTVVRCTDARHAEVEFANKQRKVISTRMIIASSGAIAVPYLQAGDYVLVQVMNPQTNMAAYVPGIVRVSPPGGYCKVQPRFYTVLMYNGQQVTTQRKSLFKISKVRFEFAIGYIAEVQNQDRERLEENVYVQTPRISSDENRDPRIEENVYVQPPRNSPDEKLDPGIEENVYVQSPRNSLDEKLDPRNERNADVQMRSHSSEENLDIGHLNENRLDIERPDNPTPTSGRAIDIASPRHQSPSVTSQTTNHSLDGPSSARLDEMSAKFQDQFRQQEKEQKELKQYKKRVRKLEKKIKKMEKQKQKQVIVNVEDSDEEKIKEDDGPTTDAPQVTSSFLEKRKSLPPLRKGEEVLARWSDEGWYFRGIVQHNCNDYSYIIEDSTRMCDRIFREDIITDYDDQDQIIQPRDRVIALHPDYDFSYAPGTVVEVLDDNIQLRIKVRFYDRIESEMSRDEVYKIWDDKYEHDVNYIVECEARWVDKAVVARNDETGVYHLATVTERIGNGREYKIKWCDNTSAVTRSTNMFGTCTKTHPLAVGDHVLALADDQLHEYLPGWVAGIVGQKINVKFCNGSIKDIENNPLHFFWLSGRYYEHAVDYFRSCREIPRMSTAGESV